MYFKKHSIAVAAALAASVPLSALAAPSVAFKAPLSGATISGTIFPVDVSPNIPATLGARNQGLNTGEIVELIAAMRAGATYVNVHTTTWPGGEVRSQIQHGHE